MSIIRTIHNKENPYAQLSKAVINDKNLSFKALGLWAWAMSKPNDWTFYVEQIAKERLEGKTAIYSAIDELMQQGYCLRLQHKERDKNGKILFDSVEYYFFEYKPNTEEIEELKKCFPHSCFPQAERPEAENQPLLNTDVLEKTEYTKKQQQQDPVVVVSSIEENEIAKTIAPVVFDSGVLKQMASIPIEQIREAHAAYLQYAETHEIDNPSGFLRKAVVEAWKPRQIDDNSKKYYAYILKITHYVKRGMALHQ